MTGFAADWLRQREPFDAAARSTALARGFGAALARAHPAPWHIVDLGAGSGANFRALAPLLAADQDWMLIDRDPLLIEAQAAEIAGWAARAGWRCKAVEGGMQVETATACWRVRAQNLDLATPLEQLDLAHHDGVTTAAFLDLVSAAWLDRLCELLARHSRPLLAALTVDGRRTWQPELPTDARMLEAFSRHQFGDKGFGPALGGLATAYLSGRLAARGYEVSTARSDWQIAAQHREMLLRMVEESVVVASAVEPAASTLFDGWAAERKVQINSVSLTQIIGHLDLLAVRS